MPAKLKMNGALHLALCDTSRLISYARSLEDQGSDEPAIRVWCDAGGAEEISAVLLEAAGKLAEAGLHRASAATCYEKGGAYPRAVTLLRAALATELSLTFKRRLRRQLQRCLRKAHAELETSARRRRQRQPVKA